MTPELAPLFVFLFFFFWIPLPRQMIYCFAGVLIPDKLTLYFTVFT